MYAKEICGESIKFDCKAIFDYENQNVDSFIKSIRIQESQIFVMTKKIIPGSLQEDKLIVYKNTIEMYGLSLVDFSELQVITKYFVN